MLILLAKPTSSQISSQPSNYENYQDVDIIVCNENEASFIDRTDNICITKGDQGCFLMELICSM